jgi:hypothetical protein
MGQIESKTKLNKPKYILMDKSLVVPKT